MILASVLKSILVFFPLLIAFCAFLAVPLLGGFGTAASERLEIASHHPFDLHVLPPTISDEAVAVIPRRGADLKSAPAQGLGTAVSYRKAFVLTSRRAAPEVAALACSTA